MRLVKIGLVATAQLRQPSHRGGGQARLRASGSAPPGRTA